jgi:PAS domain-containing protein
VSAWNPAAGHFFGIPADSAIGREFFTLPLGTEVDKARTALLRLTQGIAAGDSEEIDFELPHAEGRTKRVLLRFVRLVDGDSTVQGVLGLARPR